jgi:hypothetical protein
MHRTLALTVPPAATEALLHNLQELEDVIGLSVQRGAAYKPVGGVVTVQVLNRGADEVLRRARAAVPNPQALISILWYAGYSELVILVGEVHQPRLHVHSAQLTLAQPLVERRPRTAGEQLAARSTLG